MNIVLSGPIVDFSPLFYSSVRNGELLLERNGKIALTVDTGFEEDIALPDKILNKLKLKFKGNQGYILADGKKVNLKVYKGYIRVGKTSIEALFIPGDYLIGMRLLSLIGNQLCVDLRKNKVKLIK